MIYYIVAPTDHPDKYYLGPPVCSLRGPFTDLDAAIKAADFLVRRDSGPVKVVQLIGDVTATYKLVVEKKSVLDGSSFSPVRDTAA